MRIGWLAGVVAAVMAGCSGPTRPPVTSVCEVGSRTVEPEQRVKGLLVLVSGEPPFLYDTACPEVRLPFGEDAELVRDQHYRALSASFDRELLWKGVSLTEVDVMGRIRGTQARPELSLVSVLDFQTVFDEALAERLAGSAYRRPNDR